jgi:hypothetical protein
MTSKTPRDEEYIVIENHAKRQKANDLQSGSTMRMQLRIDNLPRYTTSKTLKKFLNTLNVLDSKIIKDPQKNYAFAIFKVSVSR